MYWKHEARFLSTPALSPSMPYAGHLHRAHKITSTQANDALSHGSLNYDAMTSSSF